MKVLLGQLGARGDCLYATAIARQIKSDHPDCHLTWAIGSSARPILEGNPHVDALWEFDLSKYPDPKRAWYAFQRQALQRRRSGEFDTVHFTQIYPGNYQNFDGTVRASILRAYPRPMTVPVEPIVRLDAAQVRAVEEFVERNRLRDYAHVILFEFVSNSGQSFVTAEMALDVAQRVIAERDDTCFVMSSADRIDSPDPRIVDGSELGFLENAELSKHCTLLVGSSSGISWLCTSDWAKKLPTVQLLRKRTSVYASMVHDHEHHGLATDHILEMTDCPAKRIVDCVRTVLERGMPAARSRFHERIALDFEYYAEHLDRVVRWGQFRKAWASAKVTLERYGSHPDLKRTLLRVLLRQQRRRTKKARQEV